jgi:hypothetical protein
MSNASQQWHLVFVSLVLGSLKNTLCESSKMLDKMCAATCEHEDLYSKTGQEIAEIQSTVTSIAEAQSRYCVYCSGLCLIICRDYII